MTPTISDRARAVLAIDKELDALSLQLAELAKQIAVVMDRQKHLTTLKEDVWKTPDAMGRYGLTKKKGLYSLF